MLWRCDLTYEAELYREEILSRIREVLGTGRYLLGKELETFERMFASYVGAKHCIGVANGTEALVLSLKALGLQAGDEVITTPFTAIPTLSAIVLAGGRPVFVDVDPETYILDVASVPDAVTEKTRAVMPVHLFTQMADIEKLRSLLPRPVPIVEDACQAHGCKIRGRSAGSLGDLSAFSFYPTKNLGGYGDGGGITTNSDAYDERLRLMRNYGKKTPDEIVLDGTNSRLDELQAAILKLKLRDLDAANAARRNVVEWYREGLRGSIARMPKVADDCEPNWHVFVVKIPRKRDQLQRHLKEQGIQTDVFYPYPHHLQPAYRHLGYKRGDFPKAEAVGAEVLALPMYPQIKREDVMTVCRAIQAFTEQKR